MDNSCAPQSKRSCGQQLSTKEENSCGQQLSTKEENVVWLTVVYQRGKRRVANSAIGAHSENGSVESIDYLVNGEAV